MANLQAVVGAIAAAQNEQELRLSFMDNAGEYFGVQRWGIYLFDPHSDLTSIDVYGVPDNFVDLYEKIGKTIDPVRRYVAVHHAPAHEELVFGANGWKQSQLYQNCCSYYNHEHIMTGPVVGDGRLIGTVNFARVGDTPAFNGVDLTALSAVCLHLSASLAKLRTQSMLFHSPLANRLTPRELQIARLVAQGLTNREIGAKLWITHNSVKQALKRMFRKLGVSSRTQMVAQLQKLK